MTAPPADIHTRAVHEGVVAMARAENELIRTTLDLWLPAGWTLENCAHRLRIDRGAGARTVRLYVDNQQVLEIDSIRPEYQPDGLGGWKIHVHQRYRRVKP